MKRKISITLKGWELEEIQNALEARERARHGSSRQKFSARERNLLIKRAVRIVASAILDQKPTASALVCTLRFFSNEELAAFEAADAVKKSQPAKPAPEASPFQMDWFREHFPTRCT